MVLKSEFRILPVSLQLGLIAVLLGSAVGCGPARFQMENEAKNEAAGGGSTPVVCDPFDPSNVTSPTSGLSGSLFSLERCDKSVSTSFELINRGKKLEADLFFSQLATPTRMFDSGFQTEEGDVLRSESGQILTEWFALDLRSKLKLDKNEAPGLYQLAILSDDGATLMLENPTTGKLETLISNEGAHPTRMACANQVVSMTADSRIPLRLTYFEGPRYHISLIVMWRKVSGSMSSLSEQECGKLGNEYFFEPGTLTTEAVPKAPYLGLLARGWKPLSAGNYELTSGVNRCVK